MRFIFDKDLRNPEMLKNGEEDGKEKEQQEEEDQEDDKEEEEVLEEPACKEII